jgi:hypothetical protein
MGKFGSQEGSPFICKAYLRHIAVSRPPMVSPILTTLLSQTSHMSDYAFNLLEMRMMIRFFALFTVSSVVYHIFLVKRQHGAPPPVKSLIPFIGSGVSFLYHPMHFLQRCREEHGDIFTMYIAGRRFHVVCDPIQGMPAVWKNHKVYSTSPFRNEFGMSLFGMSLKHVNDAQLFHANQDLFVPHLFASDAVGPLIDSFKSNLQTILVRETKKIDREGELNKEGILVNFERWIHRIMFECHR